MSAERGDQLTQLLGVSQGFCGFISKPRHDGDAAVAEDHEGVMGISDYARQLHLQQMIQFGCYRVVIETVFVHNGFSLLRECHPSP